MSILKRLYASGGPEVIYFTITVTDGAHTFRLLQGMEDMVLGGELYMGAGIDIAIPKRSATGVQDLTFAIDNTTGIVNRLIREAQLANREITATLRTFTSDDLSTPASAPVQMKVKSASINNGVAQITAGYFDILNTAWPRRSYIQNKYPGLTYIS